MSRPRHARPRIWLRWVLGAVAVLAVLGAFVLGWDQGWYAGRSHDPVYVTRTRVLTRAPAPASTSRSCIAQLRRDLAAVVPWMAAHGYVLPTPDHGWHPGESACRK